MDDQSIQKESNLIRKELKQINDDLNKILEKQNSQAKREKYSNKRNVSPATQIQQLQIQQATNEKLIQNLTAEEKKLEKKAKLGSNIGAIGSLEEDILNAKAEIEEWKKKNKQAELLTNKNAKNLQILGNIENTGHSEKNFANLAVELRQFDQKVKALNNEINELEENQNQLKIKYKEIKMEYKQTYDNGKEYLKPTDKNKQKSKKLQQQIKKNQIMIEKISTQKQKSLHHLQQEQIELKKTIMKMLELIKKCEEEKQKMQTIVKELLGKENLSSDLLLKIQFTFKNLLNKNENKLDLTTFSIQDNEVIILETKKETQNCQQNKEDMQNINFKEVSSSQKEETKYNIEKIKQKSLQEQELETKQEIQTKEQQQKEEEQFKEAVENKKVEVFLTKPNFNLKKKKQSRQSQTQNNIIVEEKTAQNEQIGINFIQQLNQIQEIKNEDTEQRLWDQDDILKPLQTSQSEGINILASNTPPLPSTLTETYQFNVQNDKQQYQANQMINLKQKKEQKKLQKEEFKQYQQQSQQDPTPQFEQQPTNQDNSRVQSKQGSRRRQHQNIFKKEDDESLQHYERQQSNKNIEQPIENLMSRCQELESLGKTNPFEKAIMSNDQFIKAIDASPQESEKEKKKVDQTGTKNQIRLGKINKPQNDNLDFFQDFII